MKYLKFTYVDAITGVSVATEPALNGTKFPPVAGLVFIWARESAYPTPAPEFFGTCPDQSATQVDGVLGQFLQSDWENMQVDEIAARPTERDQLKAQRQAAVDAIKVTTAAGHTFDGDETSQGRMARAIIALSTGLAPSVNWVLADNSVIQATSAELTEALVLAGQAQAALWVIE
jgi:hypothetical protein